MTLSSPGSTFYQRVFAIITAAVLFYALWNILAPFWGPLVWAAFLAFMLQPVHVWLTGKFKGRDGLSAGLITALTPFAILAPLSAIGTLFVVQSGSLFTHLQTKAGRIDMSALPNLESYPVVGPALRWLDSSFGINADRVREWLVEGGQNALQFAASISGNVVAGAIGTVVGFFLMLVLLFFLLRDGESWLARPIRLIPMEPMRRSGLLEHLAKVARAVVYGTGITAAAQGIATGVGFALAGLPSSVVFGVLAGLLSLLPIGGAAIVWAPGVLYLAATSSWGAAAFLLIWGLGVSSADNLLRPLLVSSRAPISTMTVFIGVLGGAAAFGAIGLVLGPLILTLIAALMQYADEAMNRSA